MQSTSSRDLHNQLVNIFKRLPLSFHNVRDTDLSFGVFVEAVDKLLANFTLASHPLYFTILVTDSDLQLALISSTRSEVFTSRIAFFGKGRNGPPKLINCGILCQGDTGEENEEGNASASEEFTGQYAEHRGYPFQDRCLSLSSDDSSDP